MYNELHFYRTVSLWSEYKTCPLYMSFVYTKEKFNTKHHGAVVEPEEKEEITKLMFDAAKQTGADDLSAEAFPEFE